MRTQTKVTYIPEYGDKALIPAEEMYSHGFPSEQAEGIIVNSRRQHCSACEPYVDVEFKGKIVWCPDISSISWNETAKRWEVIT